MQPNDTHTHIDNKNHGMKKQNIQTQTYLHAHAYIDKQIFFLYVVVVDVWGISRGSINKNKKTKTKKKP